jgi:hypothetical protein
VSPGSLKQGAAGAGALSLSTEEAPSALLTGNKGTAGFPAKDGTWGLSGGDNTPEKEGTSGRDIFDCRRLSVIAARAAITLDAGSVPFGACVPLRCKVRPAVGSDTGSA